MTPPSTRPGKLPTCRAASQATLESNFRQATACFETKITPSCRLEQIDLTL